MRQAQGREVPRFSRQGRAMRQRPGFTQATGRQARQYAAQPHAPVPATAPPVSPAPVPMLRRGFLHRHRYQLIPAGWALVVLAAGAGAHQARFFLAGVLATILPLLAGWALVRHPENPPYIPATAMLVLTVLWVPAIAWAGTGNPVGAFYVTSWLPFAIWWGRHYRVRPGEELPFEPDLGDVQLWATTLGAKGRLAGSSLQLPRAIPNGQKYVLSLKRGDQDTADVFGMSRRIASLFGKPVTEVFPERFPDGREHEVELTLLRTNSLAAKVMWDGEGISAETGLAAIGDYADGSPAHFRFWSPRNGAEQSIVVGVKGAGKSYLLHLLLSIAVRSAVPVIPIVLDPQQGQSMPDWRGEVHYAAGVAQCMTYLRAFEAGVMARSAYLATYEWTDEDGYDRPGMDFYDPRLSGLPVIFCVFDEAHLVLSDPKHGEEAKRIVGNLAKLNRKAGAHLMLVSHTLLLSQLGDMTLRAMLIGGNAICLRTGEALSGGMIGLEADPKLLPRTFPDGTETQGLGYLVGPDARPDSPMRARLVRNPRKVAVEADIAQMDEVFGRAFQAVIDREAGHKAPAVTAVPTAEPEADQPGRAAADAALTVLRAHDGPMTRGEIIKAAAALVTDDWGRAKPFTSKALQNALTAMAAEGRLEHEENGPYELAAEPATA